MNAKRLFDPRCTAALAMTAALLAFPASPVPAQEQAPSEQAEATTGDAEIMAQVIALDENEVNAARAAQQKNVAAPIQRYAKMIEQHHSKDMEEVRALSDKLGLTLTTTATVDQLHAKGEESMSRLAPLAGEEFDRAFVTEMVNGHREALQMLDDFLKTAQNDELKQHLTAVRTKIAMHLREGEKLQGATGRVDRPQPSSRESRPEQPLLT